MIAVVALLEIRIPGRSRSRRLLLRSVSGMHSEALHVKSKGNHNAAACNWMQTPGPLITSAFIAVRLKHCALTFRWPRGFRMRTSVVGISAKYAFHRVHHAETEHGRQIVLRIGKMDDGMLMKHGDGLWNRWPWTSPKRLATTNCGFTHSD